jgi:hypothetical protein
MIWVAEAVFAASGLAVQNASQRALSVWLEPPLYLGGSALNCEEWLIFHCQALDLKV